MMSDDRRVNLTEYQMLIQQPTTEAISFYAPIVPAPPLDFAHKVLGITSVETVTFLHRAACYNWDDAWVVVVSIRVDHFRTFLEQIRYINNVGRQLREGTGRHNSSEGVEMFSGEVDPTDPNLHLYLTWGYDFGFTAEELGGAGG